MYKVKIMRNAFLEVLLLIFKVFYVLFKIFKLLSLFKSKSKI